MDFVSIPENAEKFSDDAGVSKAPFAIRVENDEGIKFYMPSMFNLAANYAANNPDVAEQNGNYTSPQDFMRHYKEFGKGEGRQFFTPEVFDFSNVGTRVEKQTQSSSEVAEYNPFLTDVTELFKVYSEGGIPSGDMPGDNPGNYKGGLKRKKSLMNNPHLAVGGEVTTGPVEEDASGGEVTTGPVEEDASHTGVPRSREEYKRFRAGRNIESAGTGNYSDDLALAVEKLNTTSPYLTGEALEKRQELASNFWDKDSFNINTAAEEIANSTNSDIKRLRRVLEKNQVPKDSWGHVFEDYRGGKKYLLNSAGMTNAIKKNEALLADLNQRGYARGVLKKGMSDTDIEELNSALERPATNRDALERIYAYDLEGRQPPGSGTGGQNQRQFDWRMNTILYGDSSRNLERKHGYELDATADKTAINRIANFISKGSYGEERQLGGGLA